ncbi:MAG: NUDIX hydrolase [Chloroflexi bacterium]|nr:NUDIX hydrolase [Chloroflexota bacterium]
MISFDSDGTRFNYRVGAIIIEDGRVLLSRADWEDFWYVPGGRVEIRETGRDALSRELREELGCEANVGRLLWMAESFFEAEGTPFHEIGLYFLASLPEEADELRTAEFERIDEAGNNVIFRWIALDELGPETVLPSFLVEGLRDLPAVTEHIVHRGR